MRWKLKSDKSFLEFLRSNGNLLRVGIILFIGIALILIGSLSLDKDGENDTDRELDLRLADACSDIEGVGECRVIITYSEDGAVYAVAVLCEGGNSVEVKARVTDFISSLFGIGANRISVLKIQK